MVLDAGSVRAEAPEYGKGSLAASCHGRTQNDKTNLSEIEKEWVEPIFLLGTQSCDN